MWSIERLLLLLLVLPGTAPANTPQQSLDITPYLTEILKCNAQGYVPEQGDFDLKRFNTSWEACSAPRDALLMALPEPVRPDWQAKLEMMRSSLIDRYQTQPHEPGYGLSPEQPIKIGGVREGPARTYAYFDRLRTTDDQRVNVHRVGSCCRFETPNALVGRFGALDKYELTFSGSTSRTTVYVNIYDDGEVQAVKGFTLSN